MNIEDEDSDDNIDLTIPIVVNKPEPQEVKQELEVEPEAVTAPEQEEEPLGPRPPARRQGGPEPAHPALGGPLPLRLLPRRGQRPDRGVPLAQGPEGRAKATAEEGVRNGLEEDHATQDIFFFCGDKRSSI